MNLLLPLYVSHLGYSVAIVGVLAAVAAVATLVSRIPVPLIYRPQRSVQLLIATSVGGAITSAALPLFEDILVFTAVLVVNRMLTGVAMTVQMARFLDMLGEGTDRRKAMGWFGGTQAIGYTMSGLFVGLVVDFISYSAGFLYGAAGYLLAIGFLIGRPNPTASARPSQAPRQHGHFTLRWWHGIADPGLWRVMNANSWNNFFHTVHVTFFPVLAVAMGLTPAQVGATRAAYAGINAVGRPIAGFVLGKLTLRQVSYLGMVSQAALLFVLPFAPSFTLLIGLSLLSGAGRAIVVVAASAGLAEDVDQTRVSRGMATAAYSTTSDIAHIGAPLLAGLVAGALGVYAMFPIVAVITLSSFMGGDAAIERWRRTAQLSRSAKPSPATPESAAAPPPQPSPARAEGASLPGGTGRIS